MSRKNVFGRLTSSLRTFREGTQRDLQRAFVEATQMHHDMFYYPPVSAGGVDLIFPAGTYVIGISCMNEIRTRKFHRVGLSFVGVNAGSNSAQFAVVDNISGNTIMQTAVLTASGAGATACGSSMTIVSQEGVVPYEIGQLVYVLAVTAGALKNVNMRAEYEVFAPYSTQRAQ